MDALRHPRYEIGTVLAVGGMAEVREGWDRRRGRSVVIKRLRPDRVSVPEMHDWFEREVLLAPRLVHPGLVSVVDADELAGVPFLVFERLSGETLVDRLASGPLAPTEMLALALQLLGALAATHEAGVVHGDVKPSNVFRSPNGTWKLGDFGVATLGDEFSTTAPAGTPGYMAPERQGGDAPTVRSDLYELGVTLYEAATCQRADEGAVAFRRRLELHRGDLDPHLARAIAHCLQAPPDLRPASAEDVLRELDRANTDGLRQERQRMPTVPATLVDDRREPRWAAPFEPQVALTIVKGTGDALRRGPPARSSPAWKRLRAQLLALGTALRSAWYPTARRCARSTSSAVQRRCRSAYSVAKPRVAAFSETAWAHTRKASSWGMERSSGLKSRAARMGATCVTAANGFARRVGVEVARDYRDVCDWTEPRLDAVLASLRERWSTFRRDRSLAEVAIVVVVAAVLLGAVVAVAWFEA